MPYSLEELKSKPSYQNILDADKNELKKFFEDEEIKSKQSGSVNEAVKTLRDTEGFILSYEDPDNLGKTMPSSIQKVRLPMEYMNTVESEVKSKLQKDRKFSSFRPILFELPQLAPDPEPQTEEETKQNMEQAAEDIKNEKQADKDAEVIANATGKTTEEVKENASNAKDPGRSQPKGQSTTNAPKLDTY